MKKLPRCLLVLALLFPRCGFAAEEPTGLEPDLVYVGTTPVERPNPVYPGFAINRGEEGWVHISYIVTKEGDVTDLMIKDSSGNEAFEKAAINALNQWKFIPAKLGDEAIDSSETEAIMRFMLDGSERGASRSFVRKYNEINKMITSGSTDDVEAKLTELRFTEKHNLYEDAWFWWLDTTYAQKLNDRKRMLASVEKALTPGEVYLPADIYVYASQLAYILNVESYSLQEAFNYLDQLKESKEARRVPNYEEVVAALDAHAIKARAVINGPEVIIVDGEIRDDTYWFHTLARNAFTLAEIQGKIASIEIRCNLYQVRRYEFAADVDWEIPSSWKDCSVFLRGDVGTTFKLYELPYQEVPVPE